MFMALSLHFRPYNFTPCFSNKLNSTMFDFYVSTVKSFFVLRPYIREHTVHLNCYFWSSSFTSASVYLSQRTLGYSDIYPTRSNFTQFIYLRKLLYMFRVVSPSIIRSTYNCIYNIWYLSNRLLLEAVRNVMTHGDALEGKWRGNMRLERVATTLVLYLGTSSIHGLLAVPTLPL